MQGPPFQTPYEEHSILGIRWSREWRNWEIGTAREIETTILFQQGSEEHVIKTIV